MEDVYSKVASDPRVGKDLLFIVTRSLNRNVIVYRLRPDSDDVECFWIMYEKEGAPIEDLNMIERNTCYGFTYRAPTLQIAAMKDHLLTIQGHNAMVALSGKRCRIYQVDVAMKDSIVPGVHHIDAHGVDESGDRRHQRINA